MSADFDFSEVDALSAELGEVPKRMRKNLRQAVQVTTQGVRDDWRGAAKALSGRHARGYPSKITYDIEVTGDGVIGEVGPEVGGQGSLGFLEEGVPQQGTAPQHAARLAVRANQDDFIRGILAAGVDALED